MVIVRIADQKIIQVAPTDISAIAVTRTEPLPQSVVRSYPAKDAARAARYLDAERPAFARGGYQPKDSLWLPGSRSGAAVLVAILLAITVLGLLIAIPILMTKPPGVLRVTFERQLVASNDPEKTCPRCAETVKAAALVCRYCGHEFGAEPSADG